MKIINTFICNWSAVAIRATFLSSLALAIPFLSIADVTDDMSEQEHVEHGGHRHEAPAKLVEIVRDATRQFINVNAAGPAGYAPAFGCVSGPDHGAMGVHYINKQLVGKGEIDANQPQALIYEPSGDRLRLVGVEYILDYATWMKHHKEPPMLEGQAFQIVGSPNRYGLPAFFELHVWAWRENPNGAFVDWNTRVSCERE
jgi:hypothetical protein